MILEIDGGRIAINPDRFDKLITALRTAIDNHGTLDKESTSYNDIFDAFGLAKFYHFEDSGSEWYWSISEGKNNHYIFELIIASFANTPLVMRPPAMETNRKQVMFCLYLK